MAHNYIDPDIVKDFSNIPEYLDDVINDLKALKLKNIVEDDRVYLELADLLHDDLIHGFANYKGYVEEGMDLRFLAELRKSAIIPTTNREFFAKHSTCETIIDVKAWRTEVLDRCFWEYVDFDWQLYWVIRVFTPEEHRYYIDIDFDDHAWMQDSPKGYQHEHYLIQALKPFTHFKCNGEPREKPYDIRPILLRDEGWRDWIGVEKDDDFDYEECYGAPREILEGK